MITYKTLKAGDEFRVPVLHRVVYPRQLPLYEIYQWCTDNCKALFYTSHKFSEWHKECFVEFEDDDDVALLFRMMWS